MGFLFLSVAYSVYYCNTRYEGGSNFQIPIPRSAVVHLCILLFYSEFSPPHPFQTVLQEILQTHRSMFTNGQLVTSPSPGCNSLDDFSTQLALSWLSVET